MQLLNLKNIFPSMRKKSHDRILKEELKKQYLNTIPKFYSYISIQREVNIYIERERGVKLKESPIRISN